MLNPKLQVLHSQLMEAIGKIIDDEDYIHVYNILTQVSGDELLKVLTYVSPKKDESDTEYTLTLLGFALGSSYLWEEKIEVILVEARKKGILKEVLTYANMYIMHYLKSEDYITMDLFPHKIKQRVTFLLSEAEKEGILKEVITSLVGDDYKILKCILILEDVDYFLDKIRQIEKNIATNRAIRVGSVCGVMSALAVGGGLFAAGVALPILTLIGIAVAAALVTGLIAGGITYTVLKPSEGPSKSLDNVDAEQKVSSGLVQQFS